MEKNLMYNKYLITHAKKVYYLYEIAFKSFIIYL